MEIAKSKLDTCDSKNLDPSYCTQCWFQAQRAYIERNWPPEDFRIQGVQRVFERLRQELPGVRVCAVTANEQQYSYWLLEYVGVSQYFDRIIGYSTTYDDGTPRNKTEMVQRYLQEEGIDASSARMVFVGDGKPDMQAGKETGCYCIGVDHEYLRDAGADVVIATDASYSDELFLILKQQLK